MEAAGDVANNAYQMTKAYQALNASIAEKGMEATMAEISTAATTGAMYVGGAVVIAGAAYGSYKVYARILQTSHSLNMFLSL